VDPSDLPYGLLVPLVIQLLRFGLELWRQRRSKSSRRSAITVSSSPRSKEAIVAKYLVLYTEGSQKLRLPDDVDVPKLKTLITEAIETRRSTSIRIVTDGMESDLVLNGSRITAFTVVEVPNRDVVGL
jgi:hypothetical protein